MKAIIFVSGVNKNTLWKIFPNESSQSQLCHSIEKPLDLKYHSDQLYTIKKTIDSDEIKEKVSKEDAERVELKEISHPFTITFLFLDYR